MAKKKESACSKKPAAKVKSLASAKAQKSRAAKDAAAVKAVLDEPFVHQEIGSYRTCHMAPAIQKRHIAQSQLAPPAC